VHYLYTGSYQTLKLQDVSDVSESTTEYKRACLVYCTARLYRLDSLADYVVQNMELFEKRLSLFQILNMAGDVCPKLLEDEIWVSDYLFDGRISSKRVNWLAPLLPILRGVSVYLSLSTAQATAQATA
jgi:hypothetical protein